MSFHFYVFEYASLTNMDVFLPNTPNEVDSSWSHLMLSLKSKPWVSNTARKLWRGSPRPAWWLCPSPSSVSSIRFFSTFAAGSRCHCAFRKWPFASPSPRGDSCGPLPPHPGSPRAGAASRRRSYMLGSECHRLQGPSVPGCPLP